MIKLFALLILISGCSSKAFRKPTPLPASADVFCKPHFDTAFKQAPRSVPLNKTRYNFDELRKGLADASRACYQDYIDKNLDRLQGKVACLTFTIERNAINNIQFADVGVFNLPPEIKECATKYLKTAKSNMKGRDRVFVQAGMLFYAKAIP